VSAIRCRTRKERKMKRNGNMKKRQRLARALERAAVPERPHLGRGPRYLVHPTVATACAPSLRAIAASLRQEDVVFDESVLRAVNEFITHDTSAFFGRDVTAALHQAARLQHLAVGTQAMVSDQEKVSEQSSTSLPDPALIGS
jgi:hypothetical protein